MALMLCDKKKNLELLIKKNANISIIFFKINTEFLDLSRELFQRKNNTDLFDTKKIEVLEEITSPQRNKRELEQTVYPRKVYEYYFSSFKTVEIHKDFIRRTGLLDSVVKHQDYDLLSSLYDNIAKSEEKQKLFSLYTTALISKFNSENNFDGYLNFISLSKKKNLSEKTYFANKLLQVNYNLYKSILMEKV